MVAVVGVAKRLTAWSLLPERMGVYKEQFPCGKLLHRAMTAPRRYDERFRPEVFDYFQRHTRLLNVSARPRAPQICCSF